MIIHVVYPHKKLRSAPNIIGHRLIKGLKERNFNVKGHHYMSWGRIKPGPDDILIGHPYLIKPNFFYNSLKYKWKRKILLHPFNHDWEQNSYLDEYIDIVDIYLAISGKYWHKKFSDKRIARWKPKLKQLDLAIELDKNERVKENFNPKGKRKFLYIGNQNPGKNTKLLKELSILRTDLVISHIGAGEVGGNVKSYGYLNLDDIYAKKVIGSHDFLLTVGTYDANPTTILEAINWGLIPVCSVSSGYELEPGILNIPIDSSSNALGYIDYLNNVIADSELNEIQKQGVKNVKENFTWDRFIDSVCEELNSSKKHILDPRDPMLDYKVSFPISNFRAWEMYLKSNFKRMLLSLIGK